MTTQATTHLNILRRPAARPGRRAPRIGLLAAGLMAWTLATAGPSEARGFLPQVNHLAFPTAQVTTADGELLYGHIPGYFARYRGISRINFYELGGERHLLKAHEIRQIILPVDLNVEAEMYDEVFTSVEKAVRADYELIRNVRAIVFDAVVWPDSDRTLLLQRVNPGFDRNIQVYAILNAEEGVSFFDGIPLFGDEEKSYLAVKDNGEPLRIKKRRYRQDFERLFGDCEAFIANVPHKERKFRHFADHVYDYQQTCR